MESWAPFFNLQPGNMAQFFFKMAHPYHFPPSIEHKVVYMLQMFFLDNNATDYHLMEYGALHLPKFISMPYFEQDCRGP